MVPAHGSLRSTPHTESWEAQWIESRGAGSGAGGVVMLIEQTQLLQVGILLLDLGLVGGILEPRCPAEQRNA